MFCLQHSADTECIVYTWDHKSSQSIWSGLRVLPILNDEVQTFKALIVVHKILQEGHPVVLREAQTQVNWLDTCSRMAGNGIHLSLIHI